MLMCNGVRFKSTFQAVFLGEFLAGCRFFKISVAQPVCPWPATRRWPPWKTRNYCKVFIRSIKFNRTELMLLKHLSKIFFYFSISSHAEIGTSESNNYQLVKRDKLSIVLVLYLLLCILCIYFWHQFRCYIYSYNDRMLLQIYVTPTTLLAVEIIHCNFMFFLAYHGPEESRILWIFLHFGYFNQTGTLFQKALMFLL